MAHGEESDAAAMSSHITPDSTKSQQQRLQIIHSFPNSPNSYIPTLRAEESPRVHENMLMRMRSQVCRKLAKRHYFRLQKKATLNVRMTLENYRN